MPTQAPAQTSVEQIQTQLRDPKRRAELLADPKALLRELDLDPELFADAQPAVIGEGENTRLVFTRGIEGDAATASNLEYPFRYCLLVNKTDRVLNIEWWTHPLGIGIQEAALEIPPRSAGTLGVVQVDEKWRNVCNLYNASHLIRDLRTGKFWESSSVTCGKIINRWDATMSGNDLVLVESHPTMP